MRRIKTATAAATLLIGMALASSCDNQGDDLRDLGRRVEILEKSKFDYTDEIAAIQRLVAVVEARGYITDLRQEDGAYVITFNDNRAPIVLRNGAKGAQGDQGEKGDKGEKGEKGTDGQALLGVVLGNDGHYYWTFNGVLLRNPDGSGAPVSAQPIDGKKGEQGDAAEVDLPLPQIRINIQNNVWEVSADGGTTWMEAGDYKGDKGDQGDKGDKGEKGDKGDKGDQGDKGLTGEPDSMISEIVPVYDSTGKVIAVKFVTLDGIPPFEIPVQ